MKGNEILVGACYMAKVGGRVVPVRVLATVEKWEPKPKPNGRWLTHYRCRSEATGREITVRSPQRFRCPAPAPQPAA